MPTKLDQVALDQLFLKARSHNAWLPIGVPDNALHELYRIVRQGPTSHNGNPARLVFVRSEKGKQKLLPALTNRNADSMLEAPVTVIVAYDPHFHERLPELFPAYDARALYRDNPRMSEEVALRNSSLQGAYLMLAARALGLDCGPMSGFDNAQVDKAFFCETGWKSNFLCSLGYGNPAALRPLGSRLDLMEACRFE